mmetsp:Transcript_88888/g.163012  ORF Transcript_88888/g.163012 Transcript_88888/m.163012 type:complete len:244 (-) Transcript_88888:130-861(-)
MQRPSTGRVLVALSTIIWPVLPYETAINETAGCHPFKENCQTVPAFIDGRCIFNDNGQGATSKSREVKPNARTCYDTQTQPGTWYVLSRSNTYHGWNPARSDWCCAAGQDFSQGLEGNLMVVKGGYFGYCECTTTSASKCAGGQSYVCKTQMCSPEVTAKAIEAWKKVKSQCNVKPYGHADPPPAPPPSPGPSRSPAPAPSRPTCRRRAKACSRRRRRRRSKSRRRTSRRRSSRRRGSRRRRR